jgi:hypothetical protein
VKFVVLREDEHEWEVWTTLKDATADPRDDLFGFCVGSGDTREEAIRDAVWNVECALGELKVMV